ncbi:hypothetical protein BCU70_13265 [Vibrio sp. 10N.286.49.C2]|uniref:CsgE family curli-type amyloid fiber assembly protein n=1 Tax=unclassified Vibrio TaxID=2614977 RepID=UPI000C85FD7E|nr:MULTISPECIES: CsgE family curli-type amyloid fiber assembly protein [unclassified Vibrio]PMH39346.1 hypothetical protein BCU70_13265 [Vibrio sp. 10N.286.49.C2]PMH54304.1 hypothetical protein BCU66_11690 [Vibrio sp. 10N.286.49.B1]PMH79445.1 hypothetical protein BCU58_05260 [Vibrio sp. 10N.286.48.B7]
MSFNWVFLLSVFSILLPISGGAKSEGASNDTSIKIEKELSDEKRYATSYKKFNEINGVIVDQTMTRFGEDFYKPFSQLMNARFENLEVNLTVKERPTALSGSIISVIHRNTVIFRTAITPGRKKTELEAQRAVSVVSRHIDKWEVNERFMDRFDIARDEF